MIELVSGNSHNTTQVLFSIHLSKSSIHSSVLKNLSIIDNKINVNNYDNRLLFLGLSQFHNGVYFHMEAANSKFLLSRSNFNFSLMKNGDESDPFIQIPSFRSEKTGHTEWILFTKSSNQLIWEKPFFEP